MRKHLFWEGAKGVISGQRTVIRRSLRPPMIGAFALEDSRTTLPLSRRGGRKRRTNGNAGGGGSFFLCRRSIEQGEQTATHRRGGQLSSGLDFCAFGVFSTL